MYAWQVGLLCVVNYTHFSLYSYSHFLCSTSVLGGFSIGKPQAKFHKHYLRKEKRRKSKGLPRPLMKRQQPAANGVWLVFTKTPVKISLFSILIDAVSPFSLFLSPPPSLLSSLSLFTKYLSGMFIGQASFGGDCMDLYMTLSPTTLNTSKFSHNIMLQKVIILLHISFMVQVGPG